MRETTLLAAYRAAPGSGAVEPQPVPVMEPLMERHQEALAAQRSTIIRVEQGHEQLRALAAKILGEIVSLVEETDARLAAVDPDSLHYRDLVAFADQFLGATFTAAMKMIGATGENVTDQSGDDIRTGGGAGDDEPVDRMFGAVVWPTIGPVLRPTKGKDGKVRYDVVEPWRSHA